MSRKTLAIDMTSLSSQLESWRMHVTPIGAWDADGNRVYIKEFLDRIEPLVRQHDFDIEQKRLAKKERAND